MTRPDKRISAIGTHFAIIIRSALAIGMTTAALLLPAACASNSPTTTGYDCNQERPAAGGHGNVCALFPKLPKVKGHIDAVTANPQNPRHFTTLRLTDAAGRQWQFQSNGWAGAAVGHLKDHQIQGTPVIVAYEKDTNGLLIARFVGD